MEIREATVDDLPQLAECAKEFYSASRFLRGFNIAVFEKNWREFLLSGIGVVFLMIEGTEIIGTSSGVKYPDVNSGELVFQEFWWFMRKDHRGGGGLLYRHLEKWARAHKCTQLRMGFLEDSMPERMKEFYEGRGFQKMETGYVKDLAA